MAQQFIMSDATFTHTVIQSDIVTVSVRLDIGVSRDVTKCRIQSDYKMTNTV